MKLPELKPETAVDALRLVIAVAGIGLVGTGCWWINPAYGLIVPGAILIIVALIGGLRAR